MNKKIQEGFRKDLETRRSILLKEVAGAEADLQAIAEERESELEERAQEERTARLLAQLDDRGRAEIKEIDAALGRIDDGDFGLCEDCDEDIPVQRLRALPYTRLCVDCASEREKGGGLAEDDVDEQPETPQQGEIPADFALLRDREIEEAVRERVRADDRIESSELRIVCRHGVAHLDGVLPSEGERQILRQLLQDVVGISEIDDRLQIKELRQPAVERGVDADEAEFGRYETGSTGDFVRSVEEGLEYIPPDRPTPEEE